MAISHYKNSNGNWISIADYDILVDIKSKVDQIIKSKHIIVKGNYTLEITPDVVSESLFADLLVYSNASAMSQSNGFGFGFNIGDGKIEILSRPQNLTDEIIGITIYENGAYISDEYKEYKVCADTIVSEAFYNWWQANTVKT